jgi:acyl-CoA synthetase (AMP-forming)/AMP-acid ligase II
MCRADDDAATVATTCGRPIADFELRIDSPTEDGTGEVLLRGPNVMLGYLDDPEGTAAAIDADGWLRTGDVGRVDDAGNLSITDRLKDMYISGGFNVYPAEVEQVLAGWTVSQSPRSSVCPTNGSAKSARHSSWTLPGVTLDEKTIIAYTASIWRTSRHRVRGVPRCVATQPGRQSRQPLLRGKSLMDLNFDDATLAFQAEVRDFLARTRSRSRRSRTTPPRASSSIGTGTRCFSTPACR